MPVRVVRNRLIARYAGDLVVWHRWHLLKHNLLPFGIVPVDQYFLPEARHSGYLHLPGNGPCRVADLLDVDKFFKIVFACCRVGDVRLVGAYPTTGVSGDADVQRGISLTRQYINPEAHGPHVNPRIHCSA